MSSKLTPMQSYMLNRLAQRMRQVFRYRNLTRSDVPELHYSHEFGKWVYSNQLFSKCPVRIKK